MDTATFTLVAFVWTFIAFIAGVIVHWWGTRRQRRLLKMYRQQAQARRQLSRPIE